MSQNPLEDIAKMLHDKCSAKQVAFKNLQKAFELLYHESRHVIDTIGGHLMEGTDPDVRVGVFEIGENEFHVKIAGDLLVFILHTNIVTLDPEHGLNKSPYVLENPSRRYLGQINVYNFMADSFKYNRLNDTGYLLARFFVNADNHFLVEGDGQLGYNFNDISDREINESDVSIFIQLLMVRAVESDLITPPFPTIRMITLNEKVGLSASVGMGQKIGFQMSHDRDKPV
ncbi:hypothetical protein [Fulvivirga sedimenti]|uniref:Uncharacterized protein n=1 Tax=Fulvivirga sedimenti TaxID=2879465 RepID=A0A9X1HNA1_9BACT|nr:hypothetical protein [Fulvivirga sedimenti]MCA6073943.1 hypothetical protein [Fulvivirga sedimenti]